MYRLTMFLLKTASTLVFALALIVGVTLVSIDPAKGAGNPQNIEGAAAAFAALKDGSAFDGLAGDMSELSEMKDIMDMYGMAPGQADDAELRAQLDELGIHTPGDGDTSLLQTAKTLVGALKKLVAAAAEYLPFSKNGQSSALAFMDELDAMEQDIDRELAG